VAAAAIEADEPDANADKDCPVTNSRECRQRFSGVR
jgi:hypothetical protein